MFFHPFSSKQYPNSILALNTNKQSACMHSTCIILGLKAETLPSKQGIQLCCFNVGQRRRRWPNIETVVGECLVFSMITQSYFYRSVEIRCSLPTCQKTQVSTSSCICIPGSVSMQIQSCYYVFIIFCLHSLST